MHSHPKSGHWFPIVLSSDVNLNLPGIACSQQSCFMSALMFFHWEMKPHIMSHMQKMWGVQSL